MPPPTTSTDPVTGCRFRPHPMLTGAVSTAMSLPARSRIIASCAVRTRALSSSSTSPRIMLTIGVAAAHPVPGIAPGGELDPLLLAGVHRDVRQAGGRESLAQHLGIRDLELQGRRVGQPLESGYDGTERCDEELQRLERFRRAVRHDQDATAGSGDADHLAQRQGLVRYEHHAELGAGHVEPVVFELEGVGVHHPGRGVGEFLGLDSRLEPGHHPWCPVGGQHRGAQPRGGQSQTAGPGGHVEEGLVGSEADKSERDG